MDGISRAAGVGGSITLGGEELQVTGRVLRCYAEMEAEIVRLRKPTPLDMVRQAREDFAGDPETFELFARIAIQEAKKWAVVTSSELQEWLSETTTGFLFAVWLSVRDNDLKKYTLKKVTELYMDEAEARINQDGEGAADKLREEVESVIDNASSEDELGNS